MKKIIGLSFLAFVAACLFATWALADTTYAKVVGHDDIIVEINSTAKGKVISTKSYTVDQIKRRDAIQATQAAEVSEMKKAAGL